MISKKFRYSACALFIISFATQTIEAGLWQTICSPFSYAQAHIKQRPLVAATAAVSALAMSYGIYWWYKTRYFKKSEIPQAGQKNKRLDVQKQSHERDERINRAIAHFQNTKDLISRHESIDSKIFYEQLNSFLPQVRQALKPAQQITFDALKFGQIPEGSKEYWDACARLYFYLDDYIASSKNHAVI